MNGKKSAIVGALGTFIVGLLLAPSRSLAEEARPPFRTAQVGTPLVLPNDHGAHPQYETEWWYYTGHLVPEGADIFTSTKRYGFQLTFFRRATADTGAAHAQIYLAHAALTDVMSGTFMADSRLAAENLGFASAAAGRLDVRHLDWSAEQVGPYHLLRFGLPSLGPTKEVRLIGHEPTPLLHGDNGLSRKGSCPTCASMYYSLPRIAVAGHIVSPAGVERVHGMAWMDHEYMTNALEAGQVGWDWVSLMFRDGTDLMVFRIRSKGETPPVLAGTIRRGGSTSTLSSNDLVLEPVGERWRSPVTGAHYPQRFRVTVPRFKIDTEIQSLLPDQEVAGKGDAGISYYEGAVRTETSDAIGYLEMTGYAKPLGGAF